VAGSLRDVGQRARAVAPARIMTHTEIITYQGSPKGRTHRIRLRSSIAAWRAIQVFLRDCASGPRPRVLRLDLQKSEGETTDLDGAENYLNFEVDGEHLLGQCTLRAWLSDESSLYIFLSFPFSDVSSAGFLEYVDFIQRRLPFRLSASHWKGWHLNKRGDAFVGRRIIFALPEIA
jgi:hypothetical protein